MTTARDYVRERRHAKLTPGEALKIARELQGYSQSELARKTGIAQSALSALESGRTEMGVRRAKTLAAALGVHPAVIAFPDWNAEIVNLFDGRKRNRNHDGVETRRAGGSRRRAR
jgi:transcriptional regulator with XRE-family HTH domain